MKRIISIILCLTLLCGFSSVAFAAEEPTTAATETEETTNTVAPENWTQLKIAVLIRIIEKIFKYLAQLFGVEDLNDIFGYTDAAE